MIAPPRLSARHGAAVAIAGRRQAAAMRFIMITVLIDMLAVGLIVPVLPAWWASSPPTPEQAGWYGVVTLSYALASFVGAPVLGALSDRFGRRPVLLLGFCGLAINFFTTALATALWMLVASRWSAARCRPMPRWPTPTWPTSPPPEERARRFGLLGAMFGIGFILGPVMGGVLGASTCGCRSSWPACWRC
jgi:MFS transporter, DHA1 family, tetracycline resistance protein